MAPQSRPPAPADTPPESEVDALPSTPAAGSGDTGLIPRVKNVVEVVVSAATIIYALGYLSWAFYSWDRGFGLPPALEGQYLISGLVPAVLLVGFVLALVGLRRLVQKTRRPPTPREERWGKILQVVGPALLVIAYACGKFDAPRPLAATLVATGLILSGTAWCFSPKKADRLFVRWSAWYLLVVAPVFFFALFQLFVTRVFPRLPSEFGGPDMKAVRLDLKKAELATETLELLGARPSGESETVRSGTVRVSMPPGDFYLVLIENGGKPTHVKLRADAVRAIVPDL